MADEEPTLNIPSLLTLAVVSFFVIRWFLGSRTPGDDSTSGWSGSTGAGGRGGGRRVDPAHVEQISQMFPQLNRRDIMWDLQRNGGSVASTTERVLTGRGLEVPPPSYQPQISLPTSTPANTAASRTPPKPPTNDLITRYNLTSKIASENTTPETDSPEPSSQPQQSGTSTGSAWSQNRDERQRLLQKRRDDMIIAARRKLQEKDRGS
ncbi:hypothetical protein FQN54_002951 [Arachnomyces sp. PD_36]|nr:hypothetical protein FQN54_002951 [Arachnomyces sp. PD_36]